MCARSMFLDVDARIHISGLACSYEDGISQRRPNTSCCVALGKGVSSPRGITLLLLYRMGLLTAYCVKWVMCLQDWAWGDVSDSGIHSRNCYSARSLSLDIFSSPGPAFSDLLLHILGNIVRTILGNGQSKLFANGSGFLFWTRLQEWC